MTQTKNRILVAFCLLFCISPLLAQENLRPLSGNINYFYKDLQKTETTNQVIYQNRSVVSFTLPFKDDFSYAHSQSFPDQNLWSDSSTYVNTGHAIAPPSLGVATFDGLNKKGYPHNPTLLNITLSLPADTLTSKAINLKTAGAQTLQPSDSVALTFYYQARGFGDSPEITDTLMVDFYKPNQLKWDTKVWYARGNSNPNTNDTMFKRAFIWASDTAYLQDGFKFRFRNRATTSGDFDHWHVDYVYLDKNRSIIGDTIYNDISFGYVPSPLLNRYSAMPWQQYNITERANNLNVFIRNNGVTIPNMSYQYKMFDNGVQIYSEDGGAVNTLNRFKYNGWSPHSAHNHPPYTYSVNAFTDSVDFKLKHYIFTSSVTPTVDFFPNNDTVIYHQYFKNYYAFDDGSAEASYYVSGTSIKIVEKIKINVTDTLRALRIYFDPIANVTSTALNEFRITLWSDLNGGPGFLLLKDSANYPKYPKLGVNALSEFSLTTPYILTPGEYYIGVQQKNANQQLGIGFDRNLNHMSSLYFDSGSGWQQSQIPGSIMMRPVLGKKIPPPVGINEKIFTTKENSFYVFPNPSNEQLRIQAKEHATTSYKLANIIGQIVDENNVENSEHVINTAHFANGVYFLSLYSGNVLVQQQKIVVQH